MALSYIKRQQTLSMNVVQAARKRIINAFSNGLPVYLSMSGGKDSTVQAHLVWQLIREGKIDPSQLVPFFIDEEAIFDEVEKNVREWRQRFLAEGVKDFRWYCVEVRHYSCFNALQNDESFICWDSTQRDNWVRPMPKFAITDHPVLRRRQDTYQEFTAKALTDGIRMVGVRMAESHRRVQAMDSHMSSLSQMMKPIFDWSDSDIWRYIRDHDVPFPDTYLDLYKVGLSKREMRISQFFSIDTAKVLVRLNEHQPGLMDKVIKREPNAYLASLYWDSEMFRAAGGSAQGRTSSGTVEEALDAAPADDIDYWRKAAMMQVRAHAASWGSSKHAQILKLVMVGGGYFTARDWRALYSLMVAGDPKGRSIQALIISYITKHIEESGAEGAWQ